MDLASSKCDLCNSVIPINTWYCNLLSHTTHQQFTTTPACGF